MENIQMNDLTKEEIELIKNHRKKKESLEIVRLIKDRGNIKDFKRMNFKFENDGIQIDTTDYTMEGEKNRSSSGFFDISLTKEEILKLRDYLDLFLKEAKQ